MGDNVIQAEKKTTDFSSSLCHQTKIQTLPSRMVDAASDGTEGALYGLNIVESAVQHQNPQQDRRAQAWNDNVYHFKLCWLR